MIRAKKSLGQNFLVDQAVLKRIAEAAKIEAGDMVIEIGPGTGLLTKELLKKPLERLIAYEVDKRAIALLGQEISDARFEVRQEDFLQVDLHKLSSPRPLRIVGNIPYYITSPILFKLIDYRSLARDASLLVQLEVAERLTASPRTKAYGIPTVLANFFGEVSFIFKVHAGSFRPAPKVDSALIHIDFLRNFWFRKEHEIPTGFDNDGFRKFVRMAFAMRRKTLRNNFRSNIAEDKLLLLEQEGFLSRRAEELSVEEFVHLFQLVSR